MTVPPVGTFFAIGIGDGETVSEKSMVVNQDADAPPELEQMLQVRSADSFSASDLVSLRSIAADARDLERPHYGVTPGSTVRAPEAADRFVSRGALPGTALAEGASSSFPAKEFKVSETAAPWPNGARLAVSVSLMFEAVGQPISGAGGVIPEPIELGLTALPTNAFFQHGVREGIPRLPDLTDKHQIKLSYFMIARAVDKAPGLGREIVNRGREAAAHGRTWQNSYKLGSDAERRFIAERAEIFVKATGQHQVSWNTYWMRNTERTLDSLQSVGFKYHIDEPSREEPFIVKLEGGDFVTVRYTFHMDDNVSFPIVAWNPAADERAIRDEFDQLHGDSARRRRKMAAPLHDRVSGHASRVRAQGRNRPVRRGPP